MDTAFIACLPPDLPLRYMFIVIPLDHWRGIHLHVICPPSTDETPQTQFHLDSGSQHPTGIPQEVRMINKCFSKDAACSSFFPALTLIDRGHTIPWTCSLAHCGGLNKNDPRSSYIWVLSHQRVAQIERIIGIRMCGHVGRRLSLGYLRFQKLTSGPVSLSALWSRCSS